MEEEGKRLAAERKRADEEKRRKAEQDAREREMRELMAAEKAAGGGRPGSGGKGAGGGASDAELAGYKAAVEQRVKRNWLRPANTADDLTCEVVVRLLPDGGVQSVRIVRSSGNGAFDRSVEAAVFKSDPLPKPPGTLREITFVFKAK